MCISLLTGSQSQISRESYSFSETPSEMFSLNESSASKLVHSSAEEFIDHNKTFLTRIFPNGNRVDSSNYNPQDFWNCGCQFGKY